MRKFAEFFKFNTKKEEDKTKFRALQSLFRFASSGLTVYQKNNPKANVKAYSDNPIIFSIVNYIADCCASVQWKVYEVKNSQALKYYSKQKNILTFENQRLKNKALEEIQTDHPLYKFFENPNKWQGWNEFITSFIGYRLTTGNAYIEGLKQEYGNNKGLFQEFFVIPSQLVEIIFNKWYDPVRGYRVQYTWGKEFEIPADNVLHSKNWNPEATNGNFLYGLSPIAAAAKPNEAMLQGYNASTNAFYNNGAIGALSSGSDVSFSPEEIEILEKAYQEHFGGTDNILRVMFASGKLQWTNFGISPVDLNIIESNKWNLQDICRVYKFPSLLLNDNDVSTYNNMIMANKRLWTQNIVPLLTNISNEINRWLVDNYNKVTGKNFWVGPDWKSVADLQENFNELAKILETFWLMTPNEKRIMLDLDKSDDPLMDKIYVPSNIVPIEIAGHKKNEVK